MPHTKTIDQLYKELTSSPQGLTSQEADKRLEKFGLNEIIEKRKIPLVVKFLAQFTDLMVLILIAAAIISGITGHFEDAAVILFIVILNALIGFIQEFRAERAIEALKKMVAPHATVIRDGVEQEIDAHKLVPGDILLLTEGAKVPSDGRIIQCYDLAIAESALTGESNPVNKHSEVIEDKHAAIVDHNNKVFMGTDIVRGTGRALVISTGMKTEFGKIAHLTQTTTSDKSPLQVELFRIGKFVGKFTLVISVILVAAGWWQTNDFAYAFLFAVAVAVAAVPEGLPATITIALAMGVQRLAKKNAIVRQLSSVETLGSTTMICSDKTGTITKNEMTVEQVYLGSGKMVDVTGVGYIPKGSLYIGQKKLASKDFQDELKLCLTIGALCNDSKFIIDKKTTSKMKYKILGDPTEGSLLVLAKKAEMDVSALHHEHQRLHMYPFTSVRKMMTTVHMTPQGTRSYTKGAPDVIVDLCSHILTSGGKVEKLTIKDKKDIMDRYESMGNNAYRVLAMAYRDLPNFSIKSHHEDVEKSLIFVGLVGMMDPPRSEVKEAVKMAHKAGIKIAIVTGDYGTTAQAVARKIGLTDHHDAFVVTGADLNRMSDHDLVKIVQKEKNLIFARVDPEHKLRVVSSLKHIGEIVAVTGDGVNDAPALKRADIGVSMGITGTDVSKEASKMVLADDSFATIVSAIYEGRIIYENLKKFVWYIFSCNFGELITVFAAIIFQFPMPLTAILILCVDLGTDVLPALALGVDTPEPGIMDKPPRDQSKPIMSRNFIAHSLFIGIFIGGAVVGSYLYVLLSQGWWFGDVLPTDSILYLKASTMAFVLLVLIQMVNAFNARSSYVSFWKMGIFSNMWLVGSILISVGMIIAMVHIPFLQNFLHTTALTMHEWVWLFIISICFLFIEELRKVTVRMIREPA